MRVTGSATHLGNYSQYFSESDIDRSTAIDCDAYNEVLDY